MGILKSAICADTRKRIESELDFLRLAKRKCGSQISDVQDKASKASNIEMPELDIPNIEMGDVISEANAMLEACTSIKSRFGSMPNLIGKIDMSEYLDEFYKMIPHPAIDLGLSLDALDGLFEGIEMPGHISALDSAINCLAQACGENADSFISEANSLMSDMGVNEFGKVAKDELISGLKQTGKDRVDQVFKSITGNKSGFKDIVKSVF